MCRGKVAAVRLLLLALEAVAMLPMFTSAARRPPSHTEALESEPD